MNTGNLGSLSCLLILAAASPAIANAKSTSDTSEVAVFLDFDNTPSKLTVTAMEREVEAVMHPAGLTFNWRSISSRKVGESFSDLIVFKFHGSCEAAPAYTWTYSPEARAAAELASTSMSDGNVLPFGDVSCDEIQRFLGVSNRNQGAADVLFGRALGRVVAHEMFHMFAGTCKHSSDGIARAYHRRAELMADVFRFRAKEEDLLRSYARNHREPPAVAAGN